MRLQLPRPAARNSTWGLPARTELLMLRRAETSSPCQTPPAWLRSSTSCNTICAKDPVPRPLFKKRLCGAMICVARLAGLSMRPPLWSSECSVACRSKLYTADRTAGALNLCGFKADVWDTDAETTGAVLAAHAAAAILAGRREEQMQAALASRGRIGQAKGIIMERYGVDDVRAFEMLRLISQESQTKLAEIAQRVIDTRGEHR
jgi:hypothetical protein